MKCRKHFKISAICGIGAVFAASEAFAATKITQVEFLGSASPNQIVVTGDGPLTVEKQDNAQDKQIILEIKNAQLADPSVGKSLDTSSFNSKVSMVSPYQVNGQDTVRVVIQLRDTANADIIQSGNSFKLSIDGPAKANRAIAQNSPTDTATDAPPGPDASAVSAPISDAPPPPEPQADAAPPSTQSATQSATQTAPPQTAAASQAPSQLSPPDQAPASPQAEKLRQFAETQETRRFIGKAVTLQVRDADVADVFRLIGEASGFNVVLGEDVKGKITLSLVDVPWDLALETVLNTLRLGAERNNNILRIVTLNSLASEKQEQLKAKRAAEASSPRITRVFPISYATLGDLQKTLSVFCGSAGQANGGGSTGGINEVATGGTAIVQADARTNSIIVRDTPENIEKMKKLIEILDTQTPQVMIEAKIVEATEAFSSTIGGSLATSKTGGDAPFVASFAGGTPSGSLYPDTMGNAGVFTGPSAVSTASAGGGAFGIAPNLSFLSSTFTLNALLNLGETESQVKVVSSPKTVVLNKNKAHIVQSTPVLVPGSTFVQGVGLVPLKTVQSANLSLDVSPSITNDGSIQMELAISRDIPYAIDSSNSGIANRNITTQVIVEDGTTLVIGGIYTMSNNTAESGFPILRKIPIIGWLFGSSSKSEQKSELFIFITPRILNDKEAGLSKT